MPVCPSRWQNFVYALWGKEIVKLTPIERGTLRNPIIFTILLSSVRLCFARGIARDRVFSPSSIALKLFETSTCAPSTIAQAALPMTKTELIKLLEGLPENGLPICAKKLRKPPNHRKPASAIPILHVAVDDSGAVVLEASSVPLPAARPRRVTLADQLRNALPVGQPISINNAALLLKLDPTDNQTRVHVAQSLNRLVLLGHAKRTEAPQELPQLGRGLRTKYLYTILA